MSATDAKEPGGKPLHWKTRKKLEAAAAGDGGGVLAPVDQAAKSEPERATPRFAHVVEPAKKGERSFNAHTHTLCVTFPDGKQRRFALDHEPTAAEITALADGN